MTCIVGLVERGVVFMGGDSAAVSSYKKTIKCDPKVFKKGGMLFGTCGSVRMRQVLQYTLDIPEYHGGNPLAYLVTDFLDAVRRCFKEAGFAKEKEGREEGGTFLVGFQHELFSIEQGYEVGRAAFPYYAIGSGDEIALGSLHTTAQLDLPPMRRLELALHAAEYHSTDVGAPFVFECLQGAEPLDGENMPSFVSGKEGDQEGSEKRYAI